MSVFRVSCQIVVLSLVLSAVLPVAASGNFGAELAEFHKHLEVYQAEVESLIKETDAIVAAYREGRSANPMIDELIESWEHVGVHGAIETRATILYGTVWQAILELRQGVESGVDDDEFARRAEALAVALWQGLGGVRLAAYQVENEPTESGETSGPLDSEAQLARIRDELERAISTYAEGHPQQARELIHNAYMKRFETLEGELIALNAELVEKLELDFNGRLPQAIEQGKSVEEVRRVLDAMLVDLEHAEALLVQAESERSEVF